jgi:hypothetical protein
LGTLGAASTSSTVRSLRSPQTKWLSRSRYSPGGLAGLVLELPTLALDPRELGDGEDPDGPQAHVLGGGDPDGLSLVVGELDSTRVPATAPRLNPRDVVPQHLFLRTIPGHCQKTPAPNPPSSPAGLGREASWVYA